MTKLQASQLREINERGGQLRSLLDAMAERDYLPTGCAVDSLQLFQLAQEQVHRLIDLAEDLADAQAMPNSGSFR